MDKRAFFKRKDLLTASLMLAAAAVLWLSMNTCSKEYIYADIYYDSKVIKTIDLRNAPDSEFSVSENEHVVFQIKDRKIAFVHSDCPDRICVNTGFISANGQSAACLPNKLLLKIRSSDDTDIVTN